MRAEIDGSGEGEQINAEVEGIDVAACKEGDEILQEEDAENPEDEAQETFVEENIENSANEEESETVVELPLKIIV